jgi:hypothetical protein
VSEAVETISRPTPSEVIMKVRKWAPLLFVLSRAND